MVLLVAVFVTLSCVAVFRSCPGRDRHLVGNRGLIVKQYMPRAHALYACDLASSSHSFLMVYARQEPHLSDLTRNLSIRVCCAKVMSLHEVRTDRTLYVVPEYGNPMGPLAGQIVLLVHGVNGDYSQACTLSQFIIRRTRLTAFLVWFILSVRVSCVLTNPGAVWGSDRGSQGGGGKLHML